LLIIAERITNAKNPKSWDSISQQPVRSFLQRIR